MRIAPNEPSATGGPGKLEVGGETSALRAALVLERRTSANLRKALDDCKAQHAQDLKARDDHLASIKQQMGTIVARLQQKQREKRAVHRPKHMTAELKVIKERDLELRTLALNKPLHSLQEGQRQIVRLRPSQLQPAASSCETLYPPAKGGSLGIILSHSSNPDYAAEIYMAESFEGQQLVPGMVLAEIDGVDQAGRAYDEVVAELAAAAIVQMITR